jgi:hypothetical protein
MAWPAEGTRRQPRRPIASSPKIPHSMFAMTSSQFMTESRRRSDPRSPAALHVRANIDRCPNSIERPERAAGGKHFPTRTPRNRTHLKRAYVRGLEYFGSTIVPKCFTRNILVRFDVRIGQIDQSAARSSMWSMRPRVVSSATICAAASPAVCLSSPTISSGASGGS